MSQMERPHARSDAARAVFDEIQRGEPDGAVLMAVRQQVGHAKMAMTSYYYKQVSDESIRTQLLVARRRAMTRSQRFLAALSDACGRAARTLKLGKSSNRTGEK